MMIEILGKTIGKVFVKERLGGNPVKYLCVCPCGNTFSTTSQIIRKKHTDCGCGAVTGIIKKKFKIGDVYKGSRIVDVFSRDTGQTCYIYLCSECGQLDVRVHTEFLKKPVCSKCLKKINTMEKIKSLIDEYEGKVVNDIKVLKILGYDEKSRINVIAQCPVCGKEFETSLARIKLGIGSCMECAKTYLKYGKEIRPNYFVEGTDVVAIMPDRALNKNSTTGYKGVNQCRTGKYRAYINFKRKQYHLGTYDTIDQAVEARKAAEKNVYGDFLEWFAKEHPDQWKRLKKD